jgi:hypothetical protein
MALFRFGHAQKNAFASLVALALGQIAIGSRGLDFRLPVARDHGDCFLSILRIACHTRLKRKELQTAQQKLSERQRRGITSKPGAAPQDYGNPKTPALKARFSPVVSSMQEYRKPQQELSASIFDGRYV